MGGIVTGDIVMDVADNLHQPDHESEHFALERSEVHRRARSDPAFTITPAEARKLAEDMKQEQARLAADAAVAAP